MILYDEMKKTTTVQASSILRKLRSVIGCSVRTTITEGLIRFLSKLGFQMRPKFYAISLH